MVGRSDDEILGHVRRAIRDVGPGLTTREYRAWRTAEFDRHGRALPALHQLEQRFGSFTETLMRADPQLRRRGLRLAGHARVDAQHKIATSSARPARQPEPADSRVSGAAETPEESGPSAEVAVVIAMCSQLSEIELRELHRLLRRRLRPTTSVAGVRRVELLGPLAELLDATCNPTASFSWVARSTYDERRGADAPPSERLQRIFGSWAAACRAAAGIRPDGRKSRPGRIGRPTPSGGGNPPVYTRQEVIDAFYECANDLGRTVGVDLSSSEFHDWGIEKRARLRSIGQTPRIPGYQQVTRLFREEAKQSGVSIWAAAVAAATL